MARRARHGCVAWKNLDDWGFDMKRMSYAAAALMSLSLGLPFMTPIASAETAKVAGSSAKIRGDVARGHALANKWCASCHLVDGTAAKDQTPPFKAIAAGPKGEPDHLRAFLNQPHAPMPPLQLTNQEIEDLVVFLQSLRPVGG